MRSSSASLRSVMSLEMPTRPVTLPDASEIGTFVVVLTVSIVALRARLLDRVGGQGLPSRTDPLIGRQGQVTHDIDPVLGTGRVNVAGEDWAARSAEATISGTRVRVVAADGIVLEVTRA